MKVFVNVELEVEFTEPRLKEAHTSGSQGLLRKAGVGFVDEAVRRLVANGGPDPQTSVALVSVTEQTGHGVYH